MVHRARQVSIKNLRHCLCAVGEKLSDDEWTRLDEMEGEEEPELATMQERVPDERTVRLASLLGSLRRSGYDRVVSAMLPSAGSTSGRAERRRADREAPREGTRRTGP